MKKVILFHVFVLIAILSVLMELSFMSVSLFFIGVYGIYKLTSNMTDNELYHVSGADFYNKVLHTKSFTKE